MFIYDHFRCSSNSCHGTNRILYRANQLLWTSQSHADSDACFVTLCDSLLQFPCLSRISQVISSFFLIVWALFSTYLHYISAVVNLPISLWVHVDQVFSLHFVMHVLPAFRKLIFSCFATNGCCSCYFLQSS